MINYLNEIFSTLKMLWDGEISQWILSLTALSEDLSLDPSTHMTWLQPPVTPAPGKLINSVSIYFPTLFWKFTIEKVAVKNGIIILYSLIKKSKWEGRKYLGGVGKKS